MYERKKLWVLDRSCIGEDRRTGAKRVWMSVTSFVHFTEDLRWVLVIYSVVGGNTLSLWRRVNDYGRAFVLYPR